MSSKIPISSSPAVGQYREKLHSKDSGQVIENPKMPAQSRMQLRNRKVLVSSSAKPRIRSQTITKTTSSVKNEPKKNHVLPVVQTPESVRHVSQGAAAAATEESSRTITKKPASLAKKERKFPAGRIPILGLGFNSPTQVHLDPPVDKGSEKPSKLKTPTSTRVFRESKQFSPAHSPQVTPRRVSLLHLTLDKENTPPTKLSPNIMAAKPSLMLNSPQRLKQPSGKHKSQLPRRSTAPRTAKSTKQPKRTETYSVSSATSTSSNDGDRTTNSIHNEGELCPADTAKSDVYSLEQKDVYITKDVTRFEPLSLSTPKETDPPMTIEEVVSKAKTNIVLENKDFYVTKDMTGFQPLTQSTPKDNEPPMNIEEVICEAKTNIGSKQTSLPNSKKSQDGVCRHQVIDETLDMSSVNNQSLIPDSSPQGACSVNTVQIPSTELPTTSSLEGIRANSSKGHTVSEETITHRPQVTRVTSSIVLSSSTTSHTHSRLTTSHGQISAPQSAIVSVPRNEHQAAYPQERSHGKAAMCSMHYAGQPLVSVSVHSTPLCAYTTACHTSVTNSNLPVVQSAAPHPCVNLFPATQPNECLTTQMRPSAFADPSLAHLSGMYIRKTSVIKAASTQPLLMVSQSEERFDVAADLEVERLTQGSARTAVDPHRMVVNPIASGLDGDFRKYTFQPIHVPSRKVLQNEGSAFRRILIC